MNGGISWRSEGGSAVVDLVGFGVLLQIPILMFASLAIQTQQQSFAVESIARHGLRSFVLWPDYNNTQFLVETLAKDFGVDPRQVVWKIVCKPDPKCTAPKTLAQIEVRLGNLVGYATQRL